MKNFLAFAGTLQASRKIFWRLQERCKCHEELFGVCRNAASVTKNFSAFAGMLQVPRKTFWRLQERCKCHEKFFDVCRNAAKAERMDGAPSPPPFPPSLFKRLRIISRTSKKEGFYRFFIEKKAWFQRQTKKAVTNRKLRPKCLKLKHYAIPEIHPCTDAFSFTFAAVSIINHQIISN